MQTVSIKIRGKTLRVPDDGTKADIARYLFRLPEGYTVSEVSNALGMAYSQAHSIHKKMALGGRPKPSDDNGWGDPKFGRKPKTKPTKAAVLKRAEKTLKRPKVSPRVGKLRTPGMPSDIDVGECANCTYDLVVRKLPSGLDLIHVNITPEEYLSTIQFCRAVPKVLLA